GQEALQEGAVAEVGTFGAGAAKEAEQIVEQSLGHVRRLRASIYPHSAAAGLFAPRVFWPLEKNGDAARGGHELRPFPVVWPLAAEKACKLAALTSAPWDAQSGSGPRAGPWCRRWRRRASCRRGTAPGS